MLSYIATYIWIRCNLLSAKQGAPGARHPGIQVCQQSVKSPPCSQQAKGQPASKTSKPSSQAREQAMDIYVYE